jgi:hypothetical protein
LLEVCAATALSGAAALSMLGGLRPLSCAFRMEAARTILIDALLEARRVAYESAATAAVETSAGASLVVVRPSGGVRPLGDGVTLASVPSDGDVKFHAAGTAENATVAIACGNSTASVVVNQRGVVR